MKHRCLIAALATLPLLGAAPPQPAAGPRITVLEVRTSRYIRCVQFTELDIVVAVPAGLANMAGPGHGFTVNYTIEYVEGGVPKSMFISTGFGGVPEADGPRGMAVYTFPICSFDPDPATAVTASAELVP